MTYPLVRFVDGPSADATIRFDCNDDATANDCRVETFDAGAPTLEGDPDSVGQVFGFRSPSMMLRVRGSKQSALGVLSTLSREILRQSNWLMFQASALTAPVWLRTYRVSYESLSLDEVYVETDTGDRALLPDVWRIAVPLVADAFAYGELVTLPTFQVVQGPADLTGPTRTAMRVILPAIKGDAPTPLRVTLTPATGTTIGSYCAWLIGCVSGTSSMADTVIDIGTGDTFTAGTGTAAPTTDAAYFGGSYRAVTVGAGSGLIERLHGVLPAGIPVGRYKALLRIEADAASSIVKPLVFSFATYETVATTYGPSVPVTVNLDDAAFAITTRGWVDLGDFHFPAYINLPNNPIAPIAGSVVGTQFSLKIGTSDGTAAAVRIDAFKLIPVDGAPVTSVNNLKVKWSNATGPNSGSVVVFDGDTESIWMTAGSFLTSTRLKEIQGSFPVADPAAEQNLLEVLALTNGDQAASGTNTMTSLNAQAAVDITYYPRLLHFGDGT